MGTTVFERNQVKTLVLVVVVILVSIDFTAELMLDRNDLFNKLLSSINPDLVYKVQIWQHRKQNRFYHHDLEPNHDFIEKWSNTEYRLITNSLGFKDSAKTIIQPRTVKKRIVFIGDSFTEGVGLPYDKTFVGQLGRSIDNERYELLNAAVVSYSPKLYYHKIKYLIEAKHLKIDELYVFIDISDIFNELEYESFDADDTYNDKKNNPGEILSTFLRHNSFLYNLSRYLLQKRHHSQQVRELDYVSKHKDEANFWTLNEEVYKEWGARGVNLAETHMQLLVDLCKANGIKITVAVYPWINEIVQGNNDSRQIHIWHDFSDRNNIDFINYYPDFFNATLPNVQPAQMTPYHIVNQYFIPGDIHWNENGHRLIADKIRIRYGK